MSDKDDLGIHSRSREGINMNTDDDSIIKRSDELNLSEDDSSDEEFKPYIKTLAVCKTPPMNLYNNAGVSTENQGTMYDFSGIMKSQADLIHARERFTAVSCQNDSEDTSSTSVKKETLDKCTVEELLLLGEKNIQEDEVPDEEPQEEMADEGGYQSVEITLPCTIQDKELRRQRNKELALTKHLNRVRSERQRDLHKVHLLCLIAHGNYISEVINCEFLYGYALSFLPPGYAPPQVVSVSYIQKLLKWFGNTFPQKKHKKTVSFSFAKLEEVFTNFKPCSVRDSVILFVSLLRGLSLTARIVINLVPIPLKIQKVGWVPNDQSNEGLTIKSKVSTFKEALKSHAGFSTSSSSSLCQPGPSNTIKSSKKSRSAQKESSVKSGSLKSKSSLKGTISSEPGPSTSKCDIKRAKPDLKCSVKSRIHRGGGVERSSEDSLQEGVKNLTSFTQSPEPGPSTKHKVKGDLVPHIGFLSTKEKVNRNPPLNKFSQDKNAPGVVKVNNTSKKNKGKREQGVLLESSSSSEDELIDETETTVKCGVDYWAEVFVESEERWISVDLFSHKVDCVREISNRCTHPISYIVGWKNDGSLKDVTLRYAATWLTKKYRVEEEWWAQSLLPFRSKNCELDSLEDDQLKEMMEKAPMPTNINEFKNHPLYALPRHLLKYEAIYPQDAVPLGYVKGGEPVYSRFCVQMLFSREKWLQQGKSIKLGEKPYKIVNARSKPDKFVNKNMENSTRKLELFGAWQVEDYISPPAIDGKVPKNAYGNIEVYKPSMLPAGTVHLQVPGLLKIAQKLSIDCAPAVIGWQHHNGMSHPVVEGIIVCKEYQDILLDAWNSEIDVVEQRSACKRKLRAYKNWLKLCKSLLIRERLKKKYKFGEKETKDDEPQSKLPKKSL